MIICLNYTFSVPDKRLYTLYKSITVTLRVVQASSVSSYGRDTFTRGAPCLCLVRCPLYMFAAATYCGAPHLRRRNNPRSRPGHVVPFGTSRPGRLQPRAEAHPTRGASGSSKPSAPKADRPCFRHLRPAPLRWDAPAQQNSRNSSSISVSVKPPLQNFPRIAEAAREPKPSARPDVVKASEGHFPQQLVIHHQECLLRRDYQHRLLIPGEVKRQRQEVALDRLRYLDAEAVLTSCHPLCSAALEVRTCRVGPSTNFE
jgi:hypothetical protein